MLGRAVAERVPESPVVILGLPRGGVPVACEVSRRLAQSHADVELDVFVVRKLGVPDHEELAFGAIASGGVRVLNQAIIEEMGLSDAAIQSITRREQAELQRREDLYRVGRTGVAIANRTAILVDDGLATGATMIAAVRAVRRRNPRRVVVAVPLASLQALADVSAAADEVVCLQAPEPFRAVGYWYRDFDQVTDAEVREHLTNALASKPRIAHRTGGSAGSA